MSRETCPSCGGEGIFQFEVYGKRKYKCESCNGSWLKD